MKISAKQAAEIIKCGESTLRNLVTTGILTDYRPRKEGAQKHFALFEMADAKRIARVYRPRMDVETVRSLLNGATPATPTPKPATVATYAVEKQKTVGVITRLDKIEKLLQQLVAMWS